MARILLIGRGPLPSPAQHHTGFAQLRTRHFLHALRTAGHVVDLLAIETDHAPGLLDDASKRAAQCDVIVSAGPHRPAAIAVACAGDRPLHIDLPGSPLAELQALLRAPGPAIPDPRRVAAHAMARTTLARADHLSVISKRQEYATMGQLALLGRTDTQRAPVCTIPIAFDFPLPRGAPRTIPSTGPVRLMLSGAFAPWLDDQTLARALESALQKAPRLQVHVTGGGIEGHYTAGFERFQQWAQSTPVMDRVHLHGWVPHAELETLLSHAHIGLCLDRPGDEPTFGSRTRVLLYTWMGLHVVASPETELVTDLVDHELVTPVPVDTDGPDLADVLQAILAQPPPASRVTDAAAFLEERYAPAHIAHALVHFVTHPARHPSVTDPVAEIAHELEQMQAQLSDIHHSPTWRLLSRIHGLFR